MLQFDRTISKQEREMWALKGIVFSGYYPKNSYGVSLTRELPVGTV